MPEAKGEGFGGMPGAPDQTVNFPKNTGFVIFQVFETLNTKPTRPAIQDSEMFWCDGWMPFGPSNLRTLPGIGDSIYTVPSGQTINAFWFFNFGNAAYAAILLSNGSLMQVATTTGITTTIMPAGTIQTPNSDNCSVTQWNSKYLIIVSSQDDGYWIWNGTTLFGPGGISPEAVITNSGENYTSLPTVTFQTTSGTAVAPTFTPVLTNGFVTSMDVDTPGSGFLVDDFVAVSFSGGGSDTTAQGIAIVSPNTGQVTSIVVTNGGSNIPAAAYVTLDGGGGTGATAALIATNGSLTTITVTNSGKGYTTPPTVTFHSLGSASPVPTATAQLSFGEISFVSITDAGTGYKGPPLVTIIGDGQGAQATAIIDNSGTVTSIVMDNTGFGYTKALVTFSGSNNAAEAKVSLMPIGIQGSTVEVYVNRVWVGDERKGYFTAPSSVSDFTPSNGAGAFQSNDSFQRVAYHSFKQTNGFLYLLSDSSLNYIGGVQTTSGTPVTTVFNNLNVDPQIGTPWPSTVQLFSRNIVFANSFGIFVSYGGAVTKISGPLGGIFNTVVNTATGNAVGFPSSATAAIFGIAVYMLLFPIIDQYTGQQVNKLLMWDGKRWWTSNQDIPLTYVASQEINSILTAWGTDGSSLYPLFQRPSTAFQKVVQSKLWSNPSYWFVKTNPYIAGLLNFNNSVGEVTVTVDNERGNADSIPVVLISSGQAVWVNQASVVATWLNASSAVATWGAPGLAVLEPQAVGQVGVLIGMTITTSAADVSVLSIALLEQNYSYRGG